MTLPEVKATVHEFHYAPAQDMLYILLEPFRGYSFYEDVPEDPGVMRRYHLDNERLIGITVMDACERLFGDLPEGERAERLRRYLPAPKDEDFRELVEELVIQYA